MTIVSSKYLFIKSLPQQLAMGICRQRQVHLAQINEVRALYKKTFLTFRQIPTEKHFLGSYLSEKGYAQTTHLSGNVGGGINNPERDGFYIEKPNITINNPPMSSANAVVKVASILGALALLYLLGTSKPTPPPVEQKPNAKVINSGGIPTAKFEGREDEIKKIKGILLRGGGSKMIHIHGPAGLGKTQLTLKIKALLENRYERLIYVDCETEDTLNKHLQGLMEGFGRSGEKVVEVVNQILTTEKKYLLVFDNVDNQEIAEQVKDLLRGHLLGDVIINGRCELPDMAKPIEVLRLRKVPYEDGLKIFINNLASPDHIKYFEELPIEEKKSLISKELEGIPFMIKMGANCLGKNFWLTKESPKNLIKFRAALSNFDPKSVALIDKYLCDDKEDKKRRALFNLYKESVKSAEMNLNVSLRPMLIDVLYFYGFYGKLQTIPFPKNAWSKALKECFIKSSANPKFYEGLSDELFYNYFSTITTHLKECGILEWGEDKKDSFVSVTLPLKWAIQNDFRQKQYLPKEVAVQTELQEYDKQMKQSWTPPVLQKMMGFTDSKTYESEKKYELEKANLVWLEGIIHYFDQTVTGNQLDSEQIPLILGLFALLHNFDVSPRWKSEILNKSKLWDLTKKSILREKDPLKNLSFKDTCDLFKSIVNHKIQLTKKEYETFVDALIRHSKTYGDSNAEDLLRLIDESGDEKALPPLGRLLYERAQKEKDSKEKSRLLNEAFIVFNRVIKNKPTAIAYNNRGCCYPNDGEGRKKAILDFQEAIRLDPTIALFRLNLASYLDKDHQGKLAAVQRRIGEGLQSFENEKKKLPSPLSHDYQQFILRYLLNEGETFEAKEGPVYHSMDSDRGVLFGKMINFNPKVKNLILRGCDLNDEALIEMASSLARNSSIKCLKLEWNNKMTSKGIKALGNALSKNKSVEELSLADSASIPGKAVIDLMMQSPPQLKKIILSGCTEAKKNEIEIKELSAKRKILVIF